MSSDTQLQVERPNLFFNEYGEQTNPVSLPDTDANREILDYPDIMARKQKPSASIVATIEDDGYFMIAIQLPAASSLERTQWWVSRLMLFVRVSRSEDLFESKRIQYHGRWSVA
mgnify:CR=1 FL=1